MGRAGDRERAWRATPGPVRSPGAADRGDVIEVGGRGPRWPRPALGVGVAALIVGLVLGYTGGHLQATGKAKARPAPAPSRTVTIPALTGAMALTVTGDRCAVQLGRTLQLGIEIVNQSGRAVALQQVAPVVPLSGLRAVAARWGPCGSLPQPVPEPSLLLAPGGTRWLTVTFRVLAHCPEPFPVLFKVSFAQSGRTMTTEFDSFPDLGQVRYDNCPTSPGS